LQTTLSTTVLVTSRAPLRVRGESEFPVAPLRCPDTIHGEPTEALRRYPALALFIERAQDVRPDFHLADTNAASVAEICRRLDGLPLALELAAARTRVLSPEAMLGRLSEGLALLTGGPRDMPARQQTMRTTIAWSYDLLNSTEQAVFRHISVFAGDFSLEAATAVSGTSSSESTLDLLSSLVEKNLLYQNELTAAAPRFRMLETVREFGREQWESVGRADTTQHHHVAYFVALAETAAPHLIGAEREHWMQRIDLEMENLRAVVAWSSQTTDGWEALVRITGSLGFLYWRIRGHLHEGLHRHERALTAPVWEARPERARFLWAAGALAGYMGRFPTARGWLEESVEVTRSTNR
jgi:predicted ATPase